MSKNEEMVNSPLVSVIVPCYGMGRYIREALDAVGAQTYVRWELIAVDDCGPEDGTAEIMKSFAVEFPNHRVEWIRHDENRGVSAARNTAVNAARGELYAFLDPDDYWMPSYLFKNARILTEDPECHVACSPVKILNEDASDDELRLHGPTQLERAWFPTSLSYRNFFQPSSTVLRANIFDLIGGFDEDSSIQHIEDWDLWIRLLVAGARFEIMHEPSCVYRKHSGGATSDIHSMQRVTEALMVRHQGWFGRMRSNLLLSMMNELERLEKSVAPPRLGPIMRVLGKLDRLSLQAYDRVFKSI